MHLDPPRHLVLFGHAALDQLLTNAGFETLGRPVSASGTIETFLKSWRIERGHSPFDHSPVPRSVKVQGQLAGLRSLVTSAAAEELIRVAHAPAALDPPTLPALAAMVEEMRAAPAVIQPSAYWESLNQANISMLCGDGFANFKRTINRSYFSWLPRSPRNEHFRAVARHWLGRRGGLRPLAVKLDGTGEIDMLPHYLQRRTHATFLALLWEHVRTQDTRGLLDHRDEPTLGNPITASYRGRRVSEDMCNSAHEILSMLEGFSPGRTPDRVVELGGGYGRVAWLMLDAFPSVRYVLVDIPPALAVAQRYLTTLFPGRPTFRFRRFDHAGEVAAELDHAELAFLTPNQLDLLPGLRADLFVNISSLHEMRRDQIAHYLRTVDRHCEGFFYTKQWQRSINVADDLVIHRDEYPIPDRWEEVYSRNHPLQVQFFEALYRVPPLAPQSAAQSAS